MQLDRTLKSHVRPLLVLGRVSNLPTVVSNCLAAWLIGGGGRPSRFTILCLGAMLLYTGGMFLNDAFDESFDRQYRPERPIPAGQFVPSTVWLVGITALGIGWLLLSLLGIASSAWAAALVANIVLYDAVHKHTSFAPLLMSGCRFLLYFVAASAAELAISRVTALRALALAAYVAGISYLARGESKSGAAPSWSIGLLFVSAAFSLMQSPKTALLIATAISVLWTGWSLRGPWLQPKRSLSIGVSALLAGIVLVDWQAALSQGRALHLEFGALFVLALVVQRIAPAT